jgi:hypothetical protein
MLILDYISKDPIFLKLKFFFFFSKYEINTIDGKFNARMLFNLGLYSGLAFGSLLFSYLLNVCFNIGIF